MSQRGKETQRNLQKKEAELSVIQVKSTRHQQEIQADQKNWENEFKDFTENTFEMALIGLKEKIERVASKRGLTGKIIDEERGKLNETLEIQKEYIENLRAGREFLCFSYWKALIKRKINDILAVKLTVKYQQFNLRNI